RELFRAERGDLDHRSIGKRTGFAGNGLYPGHPLSVRRDLDVAKLDQPSERIEHRVHAWRRSGGSNLRWALDVQQQAPKPERPRIDYELTPSDARDAPLQPFVAASAPLSPGGSRDGVCQPSTIHERLSQVTLRKDCADDR